MIKREAKFSLYLRHWLKANPFYSCALEVKQTETDSLPFSAITENQLDYGSAIESDKGTLIRIQGVNGEPDYIYLRKTPAYIVIKFLRVFCLIDVSVFIKEKKKSKRKSLTVERAQELATIFENI